MSSDIQFDNDYKSNDITYHNHYNTIQDGEYSITTLQPKLHSDIVKEDILREIKDLSHYNDTRSRARKVQLRLQLKQLERYNIILE